MKFSDRIRETTSTTGNGDITLLGAVSQNVAFSSIYAVNDVIPYCVVGQTGTEWEVGLGHLSSSSVLVRDQVLTSSNGNQLVGFSAGPKDVFCTLPGAQVSRFEPMGHTAAKISGYDMP
jgi:hypothetical protein